MERLVTDWTKISDKDDSYPKYTKKSYKYTIRGFPGGSLVKNLPANAGDTGSIPDLGRPHMLQGN